MIKSLDLKKILQLVKKNIIYFFIFLLALSVRCAGIYHKDYVFIDTPFSFISSTPSNLTPEGEIAKINWKIYNFEKGKNYDIKQIKKSLFASDKSLKHIKQDLSKIRNNNIDRQHTNLYFSLFRIWTAGADETNLREIIIRGCCLNIIFFIFSFFFVYKLLSLIKDEKKFISLGLFLIFMNNLSISNTLLIREYALMEMLFILTAYFTVLFCKRIKNYQKIPAKEIILSGIAIGLFALSNYFSLIYLFIIFITLLVFAIVYKNKQALLQLLLIFSLAYLIIILIYPSFFNFELNNEHYDVIKSKMFGQNVNICAAIKFLAETFVKYVCYIQAIITIILLYLYDKVFKIKLADESKLSKEELFYINILTITSLIWACMICVLTPYLQERYIASALIILCLIPLALLYKYNKKCIGFIFFIYSFFAILPAFGNMNINNYQNILYIHNLYYENTADYNILNNYPIVIVGEPGWYTPNYFMYVNKGSVRFEDKIPDNNFPLKQYAIITGKYEKVNIKEYAEIIKAYDTRVYLKINHN